MARNSLVHRFFSMLCGVSFALFSLSTNVARPCPMHGAGGHDASAIASASVNQSHGEHHAPVNQESVPQHSCNCNTTCCGAPVVALLAASPDVSTVEAHAASADLPPLRSAPTSVRAHALPFAIGPPAPMSG